jgi:hypothetical protein
VVGCPCNWRNGISTLLSNASTRILLNGILGDQICHGRSLRQGDPSLPCSLR